MTLFKFVWITQLCTNFVSYIYRLEEFLLPGGQGIKIRIHLWKDFTEYEYRIYSFLTTWPNTNIEYICSSQSYQIQISNVFVLSNLAEYEYRIYSKQENWIFVFECVIFGGYYSNIRIYSCYTAIRQLSVILQTTPDSFHTPTQKANCLQNLSNP